MKICFARVSEVVEGQMREATSGPANAASVSQSGRNSWLLAQVVFAIIGDAVLGHFAPELTVKMKPLGGLFIKFIKLVTAPVVFLTIVTGMAGAENAGMGSCERQVA